jgi:hypothetical protein
MPSHALEFAMAAVDTGEIADRGIFQNQLRRIFPLGQTRFYRQQLPAALVVLQMLLEQPESRSHVPSPKSPAQQT